MPLYEYECHRHGAFEALRPVAESAAARDCPRCGQPSPRAILSPVSVAGMDSALRTAHALNERSAHQPRSFRAHRHGPDCGCGPKARAAATVRAPEGGKGFPSKRPWMISH